MGTAEFSEMQRFSSDSSDLYDFHLSFVSFLPPMFPSSIHLFPLRFIPLLSFGFFSTHIFHPCDRACLALLMSCASINKTARHVAEKVTTHFMKPAVRYNFHLVSSVSVVKCFYFGGALNLQQESRFDSFLLNTVRNSSSASVVTVLHLLTS